MRWANWIRQHRRFSSRETVDTWHCGENGCNSQFTRRWSFWQATSCVIRWFVWHRNISHLDSFTWYINKWLCGGYSIPSSILWTKSAQKFGRALDESSFWGFVTDRHGGSQPAQVLRHEAGLWFHCAEYSYVSYKIVDICYVWFGDIQGNLGLIYIYMARNLITIFFVYHGTVRPIILYDHRFIVKLVSLWKMLFVVPEAIESGNSIVTVLSIALHCFAVISSKNSPWVVFTNNPCTIPHQHSEHSTALHRSRYMTVPDMHCFF